MKDYNSHKKYFVFDIDRTIINGTSWFYACSYPNLLISKENISQFIKWNEELFDGKTTKQRAEFRKRTLSIIEKHVTKSFVKLIESIVLFKEMFTPGEEISVLSFYAAGYYTLNNLIKADNNAIEFIKFIKRFGCDDYKIIFLTSGYQPFMRGIIDALRDVYFKGVLQYEIFGSEVVFEYGKLREIFHMSQYQKYRYIEKMQNEGKQIAFWADDSLEEKRLQKVICEKGGMCFRPSLDCTTKKLNWEVITSKISKEKIKSNLMNSNYMFSILRENNKSSKFVKWLEEHNNRIGIIKLEYEEFEKAVSILQDMFGNEIEKTAFSNLVHYFVHKEKDDIYLRSTKYYYWMPPYIVGNTASNQEKWIELVNSTQEIFCLLVDNNCFKYKKYEYINEVRAILYFVLDHLFECSLFMLNVCEKEEIENRRTDRKRLWNKIVCLCQKTSDALVGLLKERDINSIVVAIKDEVFPQIDLQFFFQINNLNYNMRELDDNILIYKSALSVAQSIIVNNIDLTYVISFPYGGIALGFFLNSILIYLFQHTTSVKLINCHFSSKLKIRKGKNLEEVSIFDYIPDYYEDEIYNIKKGNVGILLYDNNTTTFSTISIAKQQLMGLGNDVYGAVVSVNYDNICNYLFDQNQFEILDEHWQNALDFQPVTEYTTAFNTWGTSEKTRLLEKIFLMSNIQIPIGISHKESDDTSWVYKVCRVHNVFDLKRIIAVGANMIGIHAVYHDKIGYYLSEKQYAPCFSKKMNTSIPIADFEVESIRQMLIQLPSYIQPVLVIERLMGCKVIKECCEAYGLECENTFLQLQCRVTPFDILRIKKNVTKKNIVSIGVFQQDFANYFWSIHNVLNTSTDYILLDFSKHQPDMISGKTTEKQLFKIEIAKRIARQMSGNTVPLIIADDTTPEQMQLYMHILGQAGVYYKGIDMQNNTELRREEQKYISIIENEEMHFIRIRKSMEKLEKWKNFHKG